MTEDSCAVRWASTSAPTLPEALSWAEFCLEEAEAALAAVVASVREIPDPVDKRRFEGLVEMASEVTHYRFACRRLLQPGGRISFLNYESVPGQREEDV